MIKANQLKEKNIFHYYKRYYLKKVHSEIKDIP